MSASDRPEVSGRALRCPYCGGSVLMDKDADEIECADCSARWSYDGDPSSIPANDDLQARP